MNISASEKVKYYCFNKNCSSSIFFNSTCVVLEAPLIKVFDEKLYCKECFDELLSKPILDFKIQFNQLISEEKPFKSIIIDDDPAYHRIFKELIKYSSSFKHISHYHFASEVLSYLSIYRNEAINIPDLILVDINMPEMDAWEFLDEFEALYPALSKKTDVYVISSLILPAHTERIKAYNNVKGIVTKPFDKKSLDNFIIK